MHFLLRRSSTRYLLQLSRHRSIHVTTGVRGALVGPPHPISHLRPVIYDDLQLPAAPPLLYHPYSLQEFNPEPASSENSLELQWKLQRQQFDDYSQNFWLDSNTRFEAAKEAVLTSLPSTATSLDKENALSEFYMQWLMQERSRVDEYTRVWRAWNLANLALAARVEYRKLPSRIAKWFTFSKAK